MVAMDSYSFLIVKDQGFIELLANIEPRYVISSTKYFNETVLQQAYDSRKLKTTKDMSHASSSSFTSDIF